MPEDLLETALADDAASQKGGRPDDVPEKFWDAEANAIRVEALLKSYRELEKRLSQRVAPPGEDAPVEERLRFRRAVGVPDAPEEYAIEAKHDLCCADDAINARLHEAGFSQQQAQLVYDLAAERLLPLIAEAASQFEAERQIETLRAHFGGEERFRRIAGQITAWGRANLPAPVMEALSSTAEGVIALHRMMEAKEPGLAPRADANATTDETELRAMMRDPRYWRTREPEFVRRVTDGFRRLVKG
ncbi:hypothetical protein GXW78_12245 [Roseomonas terrae]|jgi:hypothetical protein|uniref:Uncharacterized protein n=1 Tax=Neoroseomonas terrae TaxID=424799 RepID=A0ABS5EHD8_9PROT|nr:hypothetical protein [Neoroseomonas terrae]MBR0650437.1 hypothetical protein [Neoroseomonas terrae]